MEKSNNIKDYKSEGNNVEDGSIRNNNTGIGNVGDRNTGNYNVGNCNTGDHNTGKFNAGNSNTGIGNAGSYNTGVYNAGDHNTGTGNSGNNNTGSFNVGDFNVGEFNISSYNTGCFMTKEFDSKISLFDKPSCWTYKDWLCSEARHLLLGIHKFDAEWVSSECMTDEERVTYSTHGITGGYLRISDEAERAQRWWNNLTDQQKEIIRSIPNFDPDIFKQCTGIDTKD